jgi:hypothetical protein
MPRNPLPAKALNHRLGSSYGYKTAKLQLHLRQQQLTTKADV